MSLNKIKKNLLRDNKEPTFDLLVKAKKLGINFKLIYKEGKDYYLKLSYENKHLYVLNSQIYRSLDKFTILQVSNKDLVKRILAKKNIKTPLGFTVQKYSQIAPLLKKNNLGFPLVLKPGFASCGKGVAPNIKNNTELKKAFLEARQIKHKYKDKSIIIEEYFPGRDFRILVFKGRVIASCERTRPAVQGDGKKTVNQLIKQHKKTKKIIIDWQLKRNLKEQGLSLKSIPLKDQLVYLRKNTNVDQGGFSINCTSEVCAKFKKIAIDCAEEFNAQLIGVDILTSDISDHRADYRVLELNDNPGLFYLHDQPDIGRSEEVVTKILKSIFKIK